MILLIDTPLQDMFFGEGTQKAVCEVLNNLNVRHVVFGSRSIFIHAQEVCLSAYAMARLFNDALTYFHYTLEFAESADNTEEFRLHIRSK